MKRLFYGLLAAFLMLLPLAGLFAQQKYALVIGNSNYTGISSLKNPVNDANDMADALQNLGFTVDKVLDGDLEQMEAAVSNLKRRLGASRNSYGFFFYAGHGVQANGQNYLIPLPATNIHNETHLRDRSVSLQFVLDSLSEAENELNMIVLDACRDNPFGWHRSGTRGLSMVYYAPSGSIVMYAAASGQKADDGSGRNGLFTDHLLKNLKTEGLSVFDIFDRTMRDVKKDTGGRQDPELSIRFSGSNLVFLGPRPVETVKPVEIVQPVNQDRPEEKRVDVTLIDKTPILEPVPTPQPVIPDSTKLWSLGVSVGTTFSAPWFVGTVSGTLAPFRSSFFDLGIDFGLAGGYTDVDYYSLYPFAHYAGFVPFKAGGWYFGAGFGFMLAAYQFPEGETKANTFALDICTGIIIKNIFNISYTLRTALDFQSASNKLAVGYIRRF